MAFLNLSSFFFATRARSRRSRARNSRKRGDDREGADEVGETKDAARLEERVGVVGGCGYVMVMKVNVCGLLLCL